MRTRTWAAGSFRRITLLATATASLIAAGAPLTVPGTPNVKRGPAIDIQTSLLAHWYRSWGELKGASTLVVLGDAGIGQLAHPVFAGDQRASEAWTTTPIAIEQTPLGTAPHTLSVLQSGRPSSGSSIVKSDFPILHSPGRYLLFLTPSPIAGQWYPVGAPQGVFPITPDGEVNAYTDAGIAVRSVPLAQIVAAERSAVAIPSTP